MPDSPAPLTPNPGEPLPAAAPERPSHRRALLALVAVVVLGHLWVTAEVTARMAAVAPQAQSQIKRMEAVYVSEMRLSAPPVAAPVAAAPPPAEPAPRPARHKAKPPAAKASEPEAAASVADAASEPDASASAPLLADASPATPAASPPSAAATASAAQATEAAQAASDAARKGPAFVWPLASKVSFKLVGHFRGPIQGKAAVEWVRQGMRYQVHLDAAIAPFGSVSMVSEGSIRPEGLRPERYENTTRKLIGSDVVKVVQLQDDELLMPNGDRLPRPKGVQDAVSQLIHLSYQFVIKPELAQAGQTVDMKVALVRKVEGIAYEVVGEELLDTPIGKVPTLHIKPRRIVEAQASAQPDLGSVEVWLAPGLQYLPVRILTRMRDDNYLDMLMERAPQQVQAPSPGGAQPSSN